MAAPPPYPLVWLLFAAAWIGNYVSRMGFAALLPPVIHDLDLSYAAAGALTSAFFAAYAAMQLPAGVLGDRFGRRRVLLAGLVAGGLGAASTGLAVSFVVLLAARFVTGLGQGCLFSNDRAIIASVTPTHRIALGQAVSFSGPGLGLTAGLLVGGLLGELVSWRLALVLLALPTLAAALLIGRFVPAPAPAPAREPLLGRLRRLAGEPDLWRLGLAGLCAFWVQYVVATWTPVLFVEAGMNGLARAGLYSSLQGPAGVAGLLASGWLADRSVRAGQGRRGVLVGSLVAVTVATALLALAVQRGSLVALAAGVFLVAMGVWSVWAPSLAVLGDLFDERDRSTAFGLYNTICVVGALVGPGVAGWLRDLTGSFAAGCLASALVAAAGVAIALTLPPAARPPAPGAGGS